MKNILPISYPSITSFPGRANIYAISEHNPVIRSWIMENYVQTESLYLEDRLVCDIDFFIPPTILYRNHSALEAQYVFNPYLEIMTIDSKTIGEENIPDFIVSNIDRGYYLNININTSFISAYHRKSLHPIFVYGYDSGKSIFYVADFFKNGKYSFSECSFFEMENAVKNYNLSLKSWDGVNSENSLISLVKISEHFIHSFSADRLRTSLLNYLNMSCNMKDIFSETNRFTEETAYRKFGNLHYDNLQQYICRCIDLGVIIKNFRVFHVFYDHKIALSQRIKYLAEQGYDCKFLIPQIDDLVRKALIIRNIIIKESLKQSVNLQKLIPQLSSMKVEESNILLELIKIIE